jgi:hypothetical protein
MSKRLTAFVPAALVAGVLLLSACGQAAGPGLAAKDGQSTPTSSTNTSAKADVVPASSDEELQPVECGPVEVYETTHILVASPSPGGIVGCTEAFNVLDEYLGAPKAGDVFNTQKLSNGWSCSQDDGEFPQIDCLNERNGGFSFYTKNGDSGEGDPGQGEEQQPVECGPVQVYSTNYMLVADQTAAGTVGCTEAFNVIDEYQNALPGEPGDPFQTIELPSGWTCSMDDGEFAFIDCENEQGLALHTEELVK